MFARTRFFYIKRIQKRDLTWYPTIEIESTNQHPRLAWNLKRTHGAMGQSSCSEVFQAPRSKATKTPRPSWQPPVTLSPRRPPDLQQLREELQAKERALQLLRNEAIDERRVKAIEM